MTSNRHKHIRMSSWDYSQPAVYMVTICIDDRMHRFGQIESGSLITHSVAGRMVIEEIDHLVKRFGQVEIDSSVVMPNHVHLLLGLNLALDTTHPARLSEVVGSFKSATTVRYIRGVRKGLLPPFRKRLWQPGYYETVMRDERMLDQRRYYIANNPANWEDDLEMTFRPESPTRGDATKGTDCSSS